MPRAGELLYYERIGEAGRNHALAKPFSDPECGMYLQRVGALFDVLPPPPARVLECGCGTGWLAYLLARRGYDVTATDVVEDVIRLAEDNPPFRDGPAPQFVAADSESLDFEAEFDAVIFFDSLHHATDELAALRSAYRALAPGGICVALEPGYGHQLKSRKIATAYDVTEKDMPPAYIWRLGRKVGFANCRMLPEPRHLARALYFNRRNGAGWLPRLLSFAPVRYAAVLAALVLRRWWGMIVLFK